MKIKYELSKVPNQKFNINIGEDNFELRFRSFRGLTYVDLLINGIRESGSRVVLPNASLFLDGVNKKLGGMFFIECAFDDYPYYTDFDNVSCSLFFVRS